MVIDLSNVQENSFLGEGRHFVKIAKVEEVESDYGKSLKITFVDKQGFVFNEFFPLEEKFLWKLKQLAKVTKALNQDGTLDTDNLVGRYLYITIGNYTNKQGKEILTIKKFEEAKNIEQPNKVENQAKIMTQANYNQTASISIDEDQIPF